MGFGRFGRSLLLRGGGTRRGIGGVIKFSIGTTSLRGGRRERKREGGGEKEKRKGREREK